MFRTPVGNDIVPLEFLTLGGLAGMRVGKLTQLIIVLPLFLAACVSPQPMATYEDPLKQIGCGVSAASPYKSLTLGIIFTDNSKKAINVTAQTRSRLSEMGMFTNTGAMAEADPSFLAKSLDDALRQRFKDVLVLNSFDDRRQGGIDAVMFLDIQIVMGTSSGTHTTVAVQGIFVGDDQTSIAQIKGSGEATIPYPAWDYEFKPAAQQAVDRFGAALDSSTDLAAKLANPVASIVQTQPPNPPPLL
jgi:hypothetical protein